MTDPIDYKASITENPNDLAGFTNAVPIAQIGEEAFSRIDKIIPIELLAGRNLRELVARDTLPIPGPADREGYAPNEWRYWGAGLLDYLKVLTESERHGVAPERVLDFGAASGRVLRHFAVQGPASEVWGSDLNSRHVRWLQEFIPQAKAIINDAFPPLPIAENFFDLVTAFSVFTHIDEGESDWMAELRRILRPGGLAYVTIHNEATWEELRLLKEQKKQQKSRLFCSMAAADPQFTTLVDGPLPAERIVYEFAKQGPYRAQVFHSTSYVKRVWAQFFDILDVLPRHHMHQTVVVMRKPSR
jgi:SAM-dependent methyltransferase